MIASATSSVPVTHRMDTPVAKFSAVTKIFPSESGDVQALANLDLELRTGELVAIMGPSGCGKSTLLNLLAGNDAPTLGRIEFRGEVVVGPGRERGVMFQEDTLLPFRRVMDNVYWPAELTTQQRYSGYRRIVAEFRGLFPSGRNQAHKSQLSDREHARILESLRLVGMEEFSQKWPRELSGGMRKRVELARAFAQRAELLLMDEPFAKLDAFAREEMHALVEEFWRKTRCSLAFVTHDWNEAVRLADRVIILKARPGRVGTIVPVELPRPRTFAVVSSAQFLEIATRVHEAVRAMAQAEADETQSKEGRQS